MVISEVNLGSTNYVYNNGRLTGIEDQEAEMSIPVAEAALPQPDSIATPQQRAIGRAIVAFLLAPLAITGCDSSDPAPTTVRLGAKPGSGDPITLDMNEVITVANMIPGRPQGYTPGQSIDPIRFFRDIDQTSNPNEPLVWRNRFWHQVAIFLVSNELRAAVTHARMTDLEQSVLIDRLTTNLANNNVVNDQARALLYGAANATDEQLRRAAAVRANANLLLDLPLTTAQVATMIREIQDDSPENIIAVEAYANCLESEIAPRETTYPDLATVFASCEPDATIAEFIGTGSASATCARVTPTIPNPLFIGRAGSAGTLAINIAVRVDDLPDGVTAAQVTIGLNNTDGNVAITNNTPTVADGVLTFTGTVPLSGLTNSEEISYDLVFQAPASSNNGAEIGEIGRLGRVARISAVRQTPEPGTPGTQRPIRLPLCRDAYAPAMQGAMRAAGNCR